MFMITTKGSICKLVELYPTYHIILSSCLHLFYIYFDMNTYVRYDKQLTQGDLQLLEISSVWAENGEGTTCLWYCCWNFKKIFILVRELNILYRKEFGVNKSHEWITLSYRIHTYDTSILINCSKDA